MSGITGSSEIILMRLCGTLGILSTPGTRISTLQLRREEPLPPNRLRRLEPPERRHQRTL